MIDSRIVAIGLAITSGLIYVRAFENEFFKDIILVTIPAVVGLFAIKWVPNEWQQYRFKVSLKKEILDMFAKSVKKSLVVHDIAHQQLVKRYSTFEHPINLDTGGVDHDVVFPTDTNEQPLIALKNEYYEFKKEMNEVKLNGEILVSKMRLYFDSKKIGDEFFKINIQAGKCSQHIRLGFESTNKESFLKNVRAFDEESKILRNLSDKFEDKLGSQKIRKIVV